MGQVKITRAKRYEAMAFYKYNIYVDGNLVDTINAGETKIIDVHSGIHALYVKSQLHISNDLVFDNTQKTIEIEVGSWLFGWKMIFLSIFIVIFTPVILFARRVT